VLLQLLLLLLLLHGCELSVGTLALALQSNRIRREDGRRRVDRRLH